MPRIWAYLCACLALPITLGLMGCGGTTDTLIPGDAVTFVGSFTGSDPNGAAVSGPVYLETDEIGQVTVRFLFRDGTAVGTGALDNENNLTATLTQPSWGGTITLAGALSHTGGSYRLTDGTWTVDGTSASGTWEIAQAKRTTENAYTGRINNSNTSYITLTINDFAQVNAVVNMSAPLPVDGIFFPEIGAVSTVNNTLVLIGKKNGQDYLVFWGTYAPASDSFSGTWWTFDGNSGTWEAVQSDVLPT